MVAEYWLWAGWIAKVMFYLGTAISIGGAFSYLLFFKYQILNKILIKYMLIGASLGILSSIAGFLIQVGSFANSGWLGIFDATFFNILLHTSVGMVQVLRVLCFIAITALLTWKYYKQPAKPSYILRLALAICFLTLLFTFSQMGHVTNLSIFAQGLIIFHVGAMTLWMGALFPLWQLSRRIQGISLKDSMHLFGKIAAFIVAILVVCGATVAYLLLKDWNTLLTTPYGHGFIIKLVLVSSILLLAAFNKWYFTPRLQYSQFARHLSYAILFEMMLGLSILLVTGYITSVIGIE